MIKAHTDAGEAVRLALHPMLQWVLGITATLITATIMWGVTTLVELEGRVGAIEASQFTRVDAESFVRVREYDAALLSLRTQLDRIETKLDEINR